MRALRARRAAAAGALIAGGWLMLVALVGPSGNFALNDDWAYAETVRRLLAQGQYLPHEWSSMPLLTHVLWGSAFALLAERASGLVHIGLHEALRTASLVAAALALWATWALARRGGLRGRALWLVVATLAASPLLAPLAHSFMTDVPAAAALLGAAWCLATHLLQPRAWGALLGGTLLLVLATLSRHSALALGMGFGLAQTAVLLHDRRGAALVLMRAWLPLAVAATALWVFESWLKTSGRAPVLYFLKFGDLQRQLAEPAQAVVSALVMLHAFVLYLGLLGLPMWWRARVGSLKPWLLALVLLQALAWLHSQRHGTWPVMPFLGNVLDVGGVGPVLLGGFDGSYHSPWPLPRTLWLALTVLANLGGAALLARLWLELSALWPFQRDSRGQRGPFARLAQSPRRRLRLFLLMSVLATAAPLLLARSFDRYLLPLVPMLGVLVLMRSRQQATTPSLTAMPWLCTAAMALFAIATTHDHLALNRARWQAVHDAQARHGAKPRDIDAGFEHNGPLLATRATLAQHAHAAWWAKPATYVVAARPLTAHELLGRYAWRGWLTPGDAELLLLRRSAP